MKIAVIGATGRTGRPLVAELLRRGHTITVLVRDTATVLVEAMHAARVHRFVGVSGAGIDVPGDQKSLSAKAISTAIQTLGGKVVKDKPAEHAVYAASDLDWTLVRPPRLVDGEATGRLEHDAHRSTKSTKITRTDLAGFVADVLEQDLYQRQAPFVATAP